MAWWAWVLVGVGSFLTLLLFLLWLPVHMLLDVDTGLVPRYRLRMAIVGGLFKLTLPSKPARKKKKPRKRTQFEFSRLWQLMRVRGLGKNAWALGKGLIRRVHIRALNVHLRFGAEAIALYGMAAGAFAAVRPFVRLPSKYEFDVQPSFESASFLAGTASVDVSVRPLALVPPALRFLLSRSARQAWRAMRTNHKSASRKQEPKDAANSAY